MTNFRHILTRTLLVLLAIAAPARYASAAQLQQRAPGTLTNGATAGVVAWTNASNAATSNDVFATAALTAANTTTQYLKATNFGFAIPTGETPKAITVHMEAKNRAGTATITFLRLVVGGVIVGNSLHGSMDGFQPNTVQKNECAVKSAGSVTTLTAWGVSPTVAELNASNFGVVVGVTGSGVNQTVSVDQVTVRVYYDTAALEANVDLSGLGTNTVSVMAPAVVVGSAVGSRFKTFSPEDVECRWDMDNPGVYTFTDPRAGILDKSRDASTDQTGAFVAGMIYDIAGTYTVTVEIEGPDGTTDDATGTVTATATRGPITTSPRRVPERMTDFPPVLPSRPSHRSSRSRHRTSA